jgi:DNA-binding MarR family transcriptional regulator/N-acetylglutamate synthase-like GNAT family acetyltransferase
VSVEARVLQLRAFNRFYSGLIGLLREGLLETPYSLPQSRVLFELGAEPMSPSQLARVLRLDLGYVSRLLSGLRGLGLVTAKNSLEDGRSQVISLTKAGRRAFALLDERSSHLIRQLLDSLSEDEQVRLMSSIDQIRALLDHSNDVSMMVLRPPAPGDFGWVIQRHGELYEQEYTWGASFEALVARIVADFMQSGDRRDQSAWIAEIDGNRVGCVFCVKKEEGVAQLRLLLVEPSARRMGVGGRLIEECIRFARRRGYQQITLWTNDVLSEARRLYERAGFVLVEEEPHRSFGQQLIGQYWMREL